MTYTTLSDDEAGKLLKLSRAKLVAQIDQLQTENQEIKSQTIPVLLDNLKSETSKLGQDLLWLVNRLIELGAATRDAYDKFVVEREVELFPALEYSKETVLALSKVDENTYEFDY